MIVAGGPLRLLVLVAAAAALCSGGGDALAAGDPPKGSSPHPVRVAPAEAPPSGPALAPPPVPARSQRAVGGASLVQSADGARAVVAGRVGPVRKVDLHGWSASLLVDRVLAGEASLGDTLQIAWEELSRSREVRFAEDDRVLVVLDRLPTHSLWRGRFPEAGAAQKVMVVAVAGEAFLRDPDGPTMDLLHHYLQVSGEKRQGAAGSSRLAELVAKAHPAVALDALEILESDEARRDALGDSGLARLLAAAGRDERPEEIRRRALALASGHDTPESREALRELAKPGSPLRAAALLALGRFPGGLEDDRVAELLGDPDAPVRVVGVELVRGEGAREKLARAAREDAAAVVRAAAAVALLQRHGADALSETLPLLDDDDAEVRAVVAGAIGSLEPAPVTALVDIVDSGSERAAQAAIYGLTQTGDEGALALLAISKGHENEAVRGFASMAIGRRIGHDH